MTRWVLGFTLLSFGCGGSDDGGASGDGAGGTGASSSGGSAGSTASGGTAGTAGGIGGSPVGGTGGTGAVAGEAGAAGQAGAGATGGVGGTGGSAGSAGAAGSAGTGAGGSGGVPGGCNPPPATSGAFTMLTYNVAGLPQGISGSNPLFNIPQISPLLNQYNFVVCQEDFSYQAELRAALQHQYISTPGVPVLGLGDGLSRFSDLCFVDMDIFRDPWMACHGIFDSGSDCLSSKGYSVVETHLAGGVVIDVYNLHMDAGGGSEDFAARAQQTDQLLAQIATRSAGKAIIVAGDTNMRPTEASLDKLLNDAGLTDTCRELSCGDERIDRIMYRSATSLSLMPANWRVDKSFVDGNGDDLSDHEAVAVDFAWQVM